MIAVSFRSISISDVVSNPGKIQDFAESYNIRINTVPNILKSLLGSERVAIKVLLNNGDTFRVGYETKNGRIIRIVEGSLENPTVIVNTTQTTIDRINNAKDPMGMFKKERGSGNLVIIGQDLGTKLKLDAALSSNRVLWFFYSILFG